MAKRKGKPKVNMKPGTFFLIRKDIFNHANYHGLSHRAVRLLWDLYAQYNGNNNGDFSATYSIMKHKGWRSNDQLQKAKDELIEKKWIIVTRHGGLNSGCHLYGVTWAEIDECKGKLEMKATTIPLNCWRDIRIANP